jgi:hypothetical protein
LTSVFAGVFALFFFKALEGIELPWASGEGAAKDTPIFAAKTGLQAEVTCNYVIFRNSIVSGWTITVGEKNLFVQHICTEKSFLHERIVGIQILPFSCLLFCDRLISSR